MPGGDDMIERGDIRQAAVESQKGLEILDSEKLANHGALYGRFLLASQAKTEEEAANIIDPSNTKVDFILWTVDIHKDRDYNLVAAKSSIAERKEEWKGIEYSEAYKQWRTKFTDFMNNNKDSNHKSALGIIMGNPNKPVENFTELMAEGLFNTYCGDRSDIDSFVKTVARDLADNNGKIDPENLKKLLPHLQWIASGLFGKDTASQVVTRLIELESALRNNPERVLLDIFHFNQTRINTPLPEEATVLSGLHKSLIPQKPIPTEESKLTVTVVPPAVPDIPKPAPVITESDEDKDEDKDKPPSPPPARESPQPESPVVLEVKADGAASITENMVISESVNQADFIEELSKKLGKASGSNLTVSAAPDLLKDYVRTSIPEGYNLRGGKIEVNEKGDAITMRGFQIDMPPGDDKAAEAITLDLIMKNIGTPFSEDYIMTDIDFKGDFTDTVRGNVEYLFEFKDGFLQGVLDNQIVHDNPLWKIKKVTILQGRMRIELRKTPKYNVPAVDKGEPPGLTESGSSQETLTPKIAGATFSFEANPFAGITDVQMNVDYRTGMERFGIRL